MERFRRLRTVILVPYRPDGGRRDELWSFTAAWLKRHHPDYPIYIGESPAGLFNRSAAINHAATEAGDWDVAVICDSDTLVAPSQFEDAVARAHSTELLTSTLTRVVELTEESTDRFMADSELDPRGLRSVRTRKRELLTQSSVVAVPRRLWDAVGGFDEEFCGWGCEDNAFWLAAGIVGGHGKANGNPSRISGPAYHLWHPPATKIKILDPAFRSNSRRLRRYRKARTPEHLALLRS